MSNKFILKIFNNEKVLLFIGGHDDAVMTAVLTALR